MLLTLKDSKSFLKITNQSTMFLNQQSWLFTNSIKPFFLLDKNNCMLDVLMTRDSEAQDLLTFYSLQLHKCFRNIFSVNVYAKICICYQIYMYEWRRALLYKILNL